LKTPEIEFKYAGNAEFEYAGNAEFEYAGNAEFEYAGNLRGRPSARASFCGPQARFCSLRLRSAESMFFADYSATAKA
jgi:hypothetical protein